MSSQLSLHSAKQIMWIESKRARYHSFSLLTVLYGLSITVFSLSLEIWIQERPEMDDLRLIFSLLMLLGELAVMFYFYIFLLYPRWLYKTAGILRKFGIHTVVNASKAEHVSSGAGSLYLRLGAIAFGIVGVFYCGLKSYVCINKHSCKTMDILNNVLQPLFFFIQMHFIFCNSKMKVSRSHRLAKLGAMHLVAANLWTWFRLFLEKQKSIEKAKDSTDSEYNDTNASTNTNVLYTIYTDTKILMSTCVVEYSLIGAAVMLVLWMNIGRADEGDSTPVNHRRKQQMRIDCSASSTGIFVGLVYMLIVIVAMSTFDAKMHPASSPLRWSIDVALLAVAAFACVAGMLRMRRLSYSGGHHSTAEMLDEILLIIGLIGELVFCSIMLLEFFPTTTSNLISCTMEQQLMLFALTAVRLVQVLAQTLLILFSSKLVAADQNERAKPGKQFVTFLLVVNAALFILHSYKAQREAIDGASLFRDGLRLAIVKAVNPLVIFYRFHSSVCLADLWKHAYTAKNIPIHDGTVTISVLSNSSLHSFDQERSSSVSRW